MCVLVRICACERGGGRGTKTLNLQLQTALAAGESRDDTTVANEAAAEAE